jgi:hypothetical protein
LNIDAPWDEGASTIRELQPIWRESQKEILFPIALTLDRRRLRQAIAVLFANVYRWATGSYWTLLVDMVEEPLALWEKSQKTKVSDARRDKKWDALERVYWPAFEVAQNEVLRSWGFADESNGPRLNEHGPD